MKKNLQVVILLTILLAAFSVTEALAQEPPIVGNYREASTANREVISAAQFAVRKEMLKHNTRISIISIEHAETQVVAGTNYKLCLKVKRGDKIQTATAVVYQDLKQRYTLSSWKAGSCKTTE